MEDRTTYTELEEKLIWTLKEILALSPKNYWEADVYEFKIEELVKATLKAAGEL